MPKEMISRRIQIARYQFMCEHKGFAPDTIVIGHEDLKTLEQEMRLRVPINEEARLMGMKFAIHTSPHYVGVTKEEPILGMGEEVGVRVKTTSDT